ncbi:MAG: SUMF1/EgtB/PvdO family nonheme iron enzyme [Muribaculaceae bacterium]|nr:SUMF1/EgtB/PvdO family nonheme iron enzyme [Muribaculaceae bacterium]
MRIINRRLWIVALLAMLLVGSTAVVDAKTKKGKTKTTTTKTAKNGKKTSNSKNLTFTVNGVKFEMVKVDGGSFTMSKRVGYDEYEEKQVTLDSYYIGQTEVTQALWKVVMGENPSLIKNDKYPVTDVRYKDCLLFIERLNELTGKEFRLPTLAECQYAARGGNKSKGYKYSGGNDINKVAWYSGNSNGDPQKVATKAANELGIYDLCGNVSEWCNDEYDDGTRSTSPEVGPGLARPSAAAYGGNMHSELDECEIKFMNKYDISGALIIGLRLVLQQ